MENQNAILRESLKRTEAIAEAMDSVTGFLEGHPSDATRLDRCRFVLGLFVGRRRETVDCLDRCLDYIEQNWAAILQSEPWEYEVVQLLKAVGRLVGSCERLDECIAIHPDEADEILEDCWIARGYWVELCRWMRRAECVISFADENFSDERVILGPFYGLARKFRRFFAGVSDGELRELLLHGRPISSRPRWMGERCEGTLFGLELGLTCAVMNQSFTFYGTNRRLRPLKYSSDPVTNSRGSYGICSAIDSALDAKHKVNNRL